MSTVLVLIVFVWILMVTQVKTFTQAFSSTVSSSHSEISVLRSPRKWSLYPVVAFRYESLRPFIQRRGFVRLSGQVSRFYEEDREERLDSVVSTPSLSNSDHNHNNDDHDHDPILQAAADLTTSTSPLVGVTKSVGVDYGLVRTGLAVTVGYDPKPLAIVSNLNNTQLSNHIVQLTEREKAHQIIVGLPFHKNGTEAEQTVITREFANQLKCAVYAHFGPRLTVYLWDERYSSKEAAARIRASNPRANLYKELDADAACIILEYFYQDSGLGAIEVQLPQNETVVEAVYRAWDIKKKEDEKKMKELTAMRMNAWERRKAMIKQARLLDDEMETHDLGNGENKKKKKKKKKKR